ncbi:UDP-N-acetylmuramate dehydrogenase [Parasediminibacterium sp. JCM 36343]|uniref:UDP-N-acetylmuramate dehydrogenase n=1 Tax=Parasediminibacterium sp. JCM 36343 TaxID=3374279 RepID=UPI003979FADD
MQQNTSLKPYNTFGIDATAQYFASFSRVEELGTLLEYRNNLSVGGMQAPLLVLGGGSNILFTKNVAGLVLKNELKGIELIKEDADYYYIKAAAGEVWHDLVMYCVENNYAGLENLSLIPGNVGASPIQNIGAYGVEIKDVFYQLEAYHIQHHAIDIFGKDDCSFGYRESIFKQELKGQYIIVSVTFRLPKKPVLNISYGAIKEELENMKVQDVSIKNISQAVINIRSSKLPDPKQIGNAGSFFKNPTVSKFRRHVIVEEFPKLVSYQVDEMYYKLAAGWLIEQCGWKGYRKGDAGCHEKQALVLVNYGGAKGEEIIALSQEIIASVEKKFGVVLEREVNVV